MKAPAYRLHIAIAEAIQAHADYHNCGKTDLEKALSALGDAALQLLADIPDVTQRVLHANALTIGIARAVRVQIETQGEVNTTQQ